MYIQTYTLTKLSTEEILANYRSVLSSFSIDIKEDELDLASLQVLYENQTLTIE